MSACCRKEAARSLKRHRDVATCDECASLLLAYGNDTDFQRTVKELEAHGVAVETWTQGKLRIVGKPKR